MAALVTAITWDVGRLARYEISLARMQWLPATHKAPRRSVTGEPARRMADLPHGSRTPVQVSYLAEHPEPRHAPEALLALAFSGSDAFYVNGIPTAAAEPSADAYLAAPAAAPGLFPIPAASHHPGRNRYDFIFRNTQARPLTAPLYAGPEAVLRPAVGRIRAWTATIRPMLSLLGAAAAILCLGAAWVLRTARPYLPIAAAAAAAGTRAFLGAPANLEVLGAYWAPFDRALLGVTLLCLALVWIEAGAPGPRRLAAAGAAFLSAASFAAAFALVEPYPELSATAATIGVLASLLALALGVARAGRTRLPESPLGLAGLSALRTILALTVLSAAWGSFEINSGLWVFRLDVTYGLGALGALSAVAIAAVLVLGKTATSFAREQLDLSRLVRRQREEIATKSQALDQEMRRRVILEERQRLARDMHDGIGGQLISLIARVRSRRVGIDQVERELVGGLAELRLIVDSLDAAGDSLAEALAIFRSRAQPQAEAAGMQLVWRQTKALDVKADNPRWVLNLYRLLQEAVSNAVAHSGGDRLEVTIKRSGKRALRLDVADNGRGLGQGEDHGGRGLSNMAVRARQLGGELEIGVGAGGHGTRVGLTLPLPNDRRAAAPG